MKDISNEPKPLIYDLDSKNLREWVQSCGAPIYRADQIWKGLYQQLWSSPDEFTNLSIQLREQLSNAFRLSSLQPVDNLYSSDGETHKVHFYLYDHKSVETVLMRYSKRRTLCVSTQSGCAMGCVFCATGQMGFQRHLTAGEIVEQVLFFARELKKEEDRLTNIVLMGMGEPFHNYQATLAAIDRLNNAEGFNFGERRFTISTVGLIPLIEKFTSEKRQINLAISLHAANDALRTSLLPINRKYPLATLMDTCREYVRRTGRRITFEWALIHGINDHPQDAMELAKLVKGMLCHINVIPLNPTSQFIGKATTRERANNFKAVLDQAGIPCTIRIRRGIDINAGCGQLANRSQELRD